MCLYPKIIKNPKYKKTKKNGGQVPPLNDERVAYVPIGCKRCIECRKQKAREWQCRLLEDLKKHKNGKFITLTFSNESIKKLLQTETDGEVPITEILEGHEIDNWIATRAIRLFLERWRKHHKKSVRHWLVTELGHNGTENIHIHGIIWTDQTADEIEKQWQYGFVWKGHWKNGKLINYVNEKTVNYIVKYVNKVDQQHKTFESKMLTSAGIGANYTERTDWKNNKYKGTETNETYRTRQGFKIALPIYWRNKIYTEQEREKLWLHKLDNQERWVCGEKVSISKGEEEYYKLLEYYREKNTRLGYGTDKKNWSREKYEKERRIIMQKTRIQNTNYDGQKNKYSSKGTKPNPEQIINKFIGVGLIGVKGEANAQANAEPPLAPQQYSIATAIRSTIQIHTGQWEITEYGMKRIN